MAGQDPKGTDRPRSEQSSTREPKHTPDKAEGGEKDPGRSGPKAAQQENRNAADPGRTPGKAEG